MDEPLPRLARRFVNDGLAIVACSMRHREKLAWDSNAGRDASFTFVRELAGRRLLSGPHPRLAASFPPLSYKPPASRRVDLEAGFFG
jgi:hypothetical protein